MERCSREQMCSGLFWAGSFRLRPLRWATRTVLHRVIEIERSAIFDSSGDTKTKETRSTVERTLPMQTVPILSISPAEPDHAALRHLLDGTQWLLSESRTLESALARLRRERIPLVVCECNLQPGTWKDVLERTRNLPNPPSLIVTSRTADDELWAETLGAGAYDLLAKPFDAREFHRTLFQAWLRWQLQFEAENALLEEHAMAAAG